MYEPVEAGGAKLADQVVLVASGAERVLGFHTRAPQLDVAAFQYFSVALSCTVQVTAATPEASDAPPARLTGLATVEPAAGAVIVDSGGVVSLDDPKANASTRSL